MSSNVSRVDDHALRAEPIVVVAGPTATGKSALAMRLARDLGGEIVGADSVQIYRELDIGSAKPTPNERAEVTHHLVDVLLPDQPIDAGAYARAADRAIADIQSRARIAIVVGGTGLWLRALLRGLVELPPVDAALRARLTEEVERIGPAAAHAQLVARDPLAAENIHPNDSVRIVRALEVFEQTGTPVGEMRRDHALGMPRYRTATLIVDRPKEELRALIASRTRSMLSQGMIDETRAVLDRYGDRARGLAAVGYRDVVAFLRGEISSHAELEERIINATWAYSRRQRNWFRAEPGDAEWVTSGLGAAEVAAKLTSVAATSPSSGNT